MLGNEDTAISTTNAAPDVMAWKAQGTNNSDQFVMWGGGVPVLTWLVENGGDTNHYCEQSPCCSSAPQFVSNLENLEYTIDGFDGVPCHAMGCGSGWNKGNQGPDPSEKLYISYFMASYQ